MLEGNCFYFDVEFVIGCLVNVFFFCFNNDCFFQIFFEDVIIFVWDFMFEVLEYVEVLFDDIVDCVVGKENRLEGYMLLGQVVINFQMYGGVLWEYRYVDFEVGVYWLYNIGYFCELVFEVVEGGEGEFGFFMQYCIVFYWDEDMDWFGEGFVRFVESVVRDYRQVVGEV